ncbi:BRO-N domain-containing protein [Planktothrix mougeotii]|uniref:Bro-N domain-containing protein n=1 Tax=Planktothrix mougeotii LEGE 06226 TaxID=1828728 RepID=A0ABR9UFJ3_9CYAN|nr:BRO family protein [Planktothrix mougeotii]MBE9144896.1 hypothetical protein [Planktothrix mougeotii LEGE 06226]
MNNTLTSFNFKSTEIRITFEDNQLWWVAADVCDALEIISPSHALTRLDEDEKGIFSITTLGGEQKMCCVNESGLYSLILSSRKKQAKVFKRWVTGEVLPSIRQTGSYNSKPVELPSPQLISDALVAVFKPTNVDPKLISGIIANNIGKTYPALIPAMEDAKKNLAVEVTEQLLTPTEIGLILEQKTGQKHSAIKVNRILAEKGLQQPNPGKEPAWLPIGSGMEFSKLILSAQKGPKDAIRQQLKWYPSVVDQLG